MTATCMVDDGEWDKNKEIICRNESCSKLLIIYTFMLYISLFVLLMTYLHACMYI